MEIVFPLFSLLTGKRHYFLVFIYEIFSPGRDLFWRAVTWENFERSQYSTG